MGEIRPISDPPKLQRLNGFGTTLMGWHPEPEAPGWGYAQWALTLLFVPVALGFVYLVKPEDGHRAYRFAGRITRSAFVKRWGWKGYWRFKFSVAVHAILSIAILVVALVAVAAVAAWFAR